MRKKQILIVDDEEAILTVLKNSLKKVGSDYQVVTAMDGFTALDRLLEQPFDLVITDFNMAEMDGLELMEAIRYAQPSARLIMITAYGNDAIENEAKRLKAFRYLAKPLDINTFRQIVQEALGDKTVSRPEILTLSEGRYRQICSLLEELRTNVSARCILLTDATGHLLAQTGNTDKLPVENIVSLLGGGMATLIEAGRALDGDTDAINLAYHEGTQEYLYAVNIGHHLLMTLVIDRGPYSSRLGTVWYHAQRTAVTLRQALNQAEHTSPQEVFDKNFDQAFDAELDNLFAESKF